MKNSGYKRIIAPVAGLMLLLGIAIVGCGSKGVADEPNTTTVEETTPVVEASIKADKPTDTSFLLKGKLVEGAGDLVVLQKLELGQLSFVDSVRADEKGRYSFNASADKPMFYYITVNSMKPPGVPVLLSNGKALELNLTIGDYIETEVKGDVANDQLKSLYDIYLGHNKADIAFQQKYSNVNPKTVTDSFRRAANAEYTKIQKQRKSDIESFIANTPGGPATYFATTYVVQKPTPEMLDNALTKLKADAPESLFTERLETRINSIGALEIGGLAPEIELASPTGEMVKLSSLRGNVVLIDFWASWCRPCRAENPNVVRVYNKYKDKGFEVFSVSLDNSADRWKAAIQQDQLTWTHVSDLRGWKSSAAALYQVSGIPKTFLLDKNGRIIAKDLRGHQLEAKLAEIFN
jgi:peroxiredoxin